VLFALNSVRLSAGTLAILSGSNAGNTAIEGNNVSANDVIINGGGNLGVSWAIPVPGANWISFTQSAPSGVILPNACPVGMQILVSGNLQCPNGFSSGALITPTATYYYNFSLDGPSVSGNLSVYADDVASVFLDGSPVLVLPGTLSYSQYCVSSPGGCAPGNGATISLAGLGSGAHMLTFQTYNLWGDTYGLLYEGQVNTASATPEPGTMALAGMAALLLLNCVTRKAAARN
jgi:hypothetical protein